jgi:uncharacterized protein (DUF2236 family)
MDVEHVLVYGRPMELAARLNRWDLGLRARIRAEIEAGGGRHDEPEIYDGPRGDPGLVGGPDSMSWEINGDFASISAAGSAAIIMEVLHPSVMAGVFQQSSYRTEPLRRARNTLGYVLGTTFGNTEAATALIERVKRVHTRVQGTRPDGQPYRALDPELLAWVHTAIPWAIMEAFHRYRRPLTTEEKNRYLTEQAVIGRMSGANWVPETVAELDEYAAHMRPLLAMNEQTRSFINFLAGDTEGELRATDLQQVQRRHDLAASMTLMPPWARQLSGTYMPSLVQRLYLAPRGRLQVNIVRWAYPELPCRQLALERVSRGVRRSTSAA